MSDTVLVIQHAAGEGPGTLAKALDDRGLRVVLLRLDRGDVVPEALSPHRGLVVLGGPMGVYERDRYAWLEGELALIRDAVFAGKPTIGICLGAELLAASLSARVAKTGRPEIGWHPVELSAAAADDPLFSACPRCFVPLHWHGDAFELPASAVSLASSPQTPVQAFRFEQHAWGVLFHLEVTTEIVRAMVEGFPHEMASAGVKREEILGDLSRRLNALQPVAAEVFAGWAHLAAR